MEERMSQTEFLDVMYTALKQIDHKAYMLESLSDNFAAVGNEHVAMKLEDAAIALKEATKEIRGSYGLMLNTRAKDDQKFLSETIKFALTGS